MEDVIVYCGKRTAIGKICGSLSHLSVDKLGAHVIRAALADSSPAILYDDVNEVVFGQVLSAGCGINCARQASLNSGLSDKVTASTVNMVCGSGLKSIATAAQSIRYGEAQVIVAGGMESMSQAPHLIRLRVPKQSNGAAAVAPALPELPKFGDMALVDSMVNDGLTDPVLHCRMGDTAELVAQRCGIKRTEQDLFAVRSHAQWDIAHKAGRFEREIVPVSLNATLSFNVDELPRPGLTIDKLAKLPPAFEIPKALKISNGTVNGGYEYTVTAGNCSGLNDGAAAVVLVSSSFLKNRLLAHPTCGRGLARIVSWSQSGGQPELMGIEVVPAVQKALSKAGWSVDSVDFWEINEAFAVTTIVAIKQLGIPDWEKRVNINGGATAIGHPIGCSGARLIVTLSHQLALMQAENPTKRFRGVATACIGGGQAIAACLESIPST